jgi:hypothetical protein
MRQQRAERVMLAMIFWSDRIASGGSNPCVMEFAYLFYALAHPCYPQLNDGANPMTVFRPLTRILA